MKALHRFVLTVASAAFFVGSAQAQNGGTVTQHAFAIGKGAGVTGYTSLLCGSAQLAVGQAAADPICSTITGDVTISPGGVTALGNIPSGTPVAGSLLGTAIAAPATPAAGKVSVWTDSTDNRLHDKNSAGTIGTTVVPSTAPANQWANGVSVAGAIQYAQINFSNLAGSLSCAQHPALTGDVTNSAGSCATTISANAVTNAKMATMLPWTFKANNTSGSAVPSDITIDGQTLKASPASGDEIFLWDVAGAALKKTTVSALASAGSVASVNGQTGAVTLLVEPQGRLTLQSATPVMTTTQSAKTTVYYTPYHGNMVPLYDGTNMVPTATAEISVATTDTTKNPAAIGASKVNDWFIWNDSGTIRISHGPDWTNDTTRSAGTALTLVNGIYLNSAAITNGPAASRGTYVGTTQSNASSQIDYIFGASASGGTAAFFGVWNAYNRTNVATDVMDSGTSYTYSSSTTRQARASAGNQVSFVLGLQEDGVFASYSDRSDTAAVMFARSTFGLGLDSTSSFAGQPSQVIAGSAASVVAAGTSAKTFYPGIGLHFIAALEAGDGTNSNTFNSSSLATLSVMLRN